MIKRFDNRREGGRALAVRLAEFKDRGDTLILALPRGGVPVAYEVAGELNLPLDVFLVRKLGVPGQEELAFGAIASGGITVFNEGILRSLRMPAALIENVIRREQAELERRERLYRAGRAALDLKDKICVIVDDGLATGATVRAAIAAVGRLDPKKIIVAAPVAARECCDDISDSCGALCICEITPEPFYGVGMWYRHFPQTTDEEVQNLLARAERNFSGKSLAA